MSPRHELRLAFEESDRRKTATETKTPLRIHPYLALYAVKFTPDGDVWDGDWRHPLAVYEFHEAEAALDHAERISRNPELFARATEHSAEPVKDPDAVVVNDHAGNELGRFRLGWVQVVVAPEKTTRRGWRSMVAAMLWRILGY